MGVLGIGYAAWTDTIAIDGTVTTGEVCIKFSQSSGWDDQDGPPPYIPTDDPDFNAIPGPGFPFTAYLVDKNVGWGVSEVSVDGKTLTVALHNVYPSYYNHLGFVIWNCGTIPVKIQKFIFKDGDGVIVKEVPPDDRYFTLDLSGDPGDVPDLELWWGNDAGTQLEPGDGVNHSFSVHMLQDETIDFSEPQSFTFSIEIVAIQWDKY